MDVLTLRNLHKAFGRQKVLQGIDLTVPQHSIFGFIGKNGAGKTTTMKTILGLEKADAGELYIIRDRKKTMCHVFQRDEAAPCDCAGAAE